MERSSGLTVVEFPVIYLFERENTEGSLTKVFPVFACISSLVIQKSLVNLVFLLQK
jgi:hypothetical protein